MKTKLSRMLSLQDLGMNPKPARVDQYIELRKMFEQGEDYRNDMDLARR